MGNSLPPPPPRARGSLFRKRQSPTDRSETLSTVTPRAGMPPSSSAASQSPAVSPSPPPMTEDQRRRVREAEKILQEIANEYAAKRAAGLVPTRPVPARTLLWEELEAQRLRVGRRGQCVFGRDGDALCGCAAYRKKRLPGGQENAGGVCEGCGHGGPWHRLTGGTMWSVSMRDSRSRTRSHGTVNGSGRGGRSLASSSARSRRLELSDSLVEAEAEAEDYEDDDYDEDYDSDYDDSDDDDDDDESIALEMARPYGFVGADPTPPLVRVDDAGGGGELSPVDRSSLFSNSSNLGLPPRLSSTSRHLDRLLGAIAKYRALGLSEDEIEARIREDFPPAERLSVAAAPRFDPDEL